jgi:hypothetical protein
MLEMKNGAGLTVVRNLRKKIIQKLTEWHQKNNNSLQYLIASWLLLNGFRFCFRLSIFFEGILRRFSFFD